MWVVFKIGSFHLYRPISPIILDGFGNHVSKEETLTCTIQPAKKNTPSCWAWLLVKLRCSSASFDFWVWSKGPNPATNDPFWSNAGDFVVSPQRMKISEGGYLILYHQKGKVGFSKTLPKNGSFQVAAWEHFLEPRWGDSKKSLRGCYCWWLQKSGVHQLIL